MKKKTTNLKKLIKKADSLWSQCVRSRDHRKNLSKEASLILWDYCLKNNIPVSIEDFKE